MTTLSTIKKSNQELYKSIMDELTEHRANKVNQQVSQEKKAQVKKRKNELDFQMELKRIDEIYKTV